MISDAITEVLDLQMVGIFEVLNLLQNDLDNLEKQSMGKTTSPSTTLNFVQRMSETIFGVVLHGELYDISYVLNPIRLLRANKYTVSDMGKMVIRKAPPETIAYLKYNDMYDDEPICIANTNTIINAYVDVLLVYYNDLLHDMGPTYGNPHVQDAFSPTGITKNKLFWESHKLQLATNINSICKMLVTPIHAKVLHISCQSYVHFEKDAIVYGIDYYHTDSPPICVKP